MQIHFVSTYNGDGVKIVALFSKANLPEKMVIKEDFRHLNEFQKAELGSFGVNREKEPERRLKMRSSKQAKMNVDGLKDVKVRARCP